MQLTQAATTGLSLSPLPNTASIGKVLIISGRCRPQVTHRHFPVDLTLYLIHVQMEQSSKVVANRGSLRSHNVSDNVSFCWWAVSRFCRYPYCVGLCASPPHPFSLMVNTSRVLDVLQQVCGFGHGLEHQDTNGR